MELAPQVPHAWASPEIAAVPVPEQLKAQFTKVWPAARALAQAELAPIREAMTKEMADLKEGMARSQAENEEAVRILEVRLEN